MAGRFIRLIVAISMNGQDSVDKTINATPIVRLKNHRESTGDAVRFAEVT
jgi:hypothetical protein